MSLFSNDIRVANTASPSFQSKANVSQYGWTGADQGHYNQLLQYVDECRKIWLNLEEKILYVETILETVTSIDVQVKYVEQMTGEVLKWRLETLSARDQVVTIYENVQPLYQDFLDKYSDISGMYVDMVTLHKESVDAHAGAVSAEVGAKSWHDKAYDLYLDLKEGQVYRGVWDPTTNAFPSHEGTNSVWDVILPNGTLEHVFGGYTWRSGDRLLYVVSASAYQQLATGGGVISVNGKTGAVTITKEDLNAATSTSYGGDLNDLNSTGFYSLESSTENRPSGSQGRGDHVIVHHWDSNAGYQIYTVYNSGKMFTRNKTGGIWSGWKQVYDTGNKPNASDVGALPTTGGNLSGPLVLNSGNVSRLTLNNNFVMGSNDSIILRDHGNGHVTLSGSVNSAGAPGQLYLGYNAAATGTAGYNTSTVRLESAMTWKGAHNVVDSNGKVPYSTINGAAPSGFGLGESEAFTVADMNSSPMTWNEGKMGWFRAISSTANKPGDQVGVGTLTRYQKEATSAVYIQFFGNNGRVYTRVWVNSAWGTWVTNYATNVKPNAADVGAVPTTDITTVGEGGKIPRISNGGVLEIGQHLDFHFENTSRDYDARLHVTQNSDGTNYTLNSVGNFNASRQLFENGNRVYSEGYRPTALDVGALPMDGGGRINGNLELTGGLVTQTGVTINGSGNVQAMHGGYLRCNTDSVMSMDGKEYAFVTSKRDAHLCNNSYWNGRDWVKYEDSIESHYVAAKQGGLEHLWSEAGNSNPNQYRSQILSGHNTGYVNASSVLVPEAGNGWMINDYELLVYKFPNGLHIKGIIRRSPSVGKVNNVIFYLHANAKIPYSTFLLDKTTTTAPNGWSYTENISFNTNAVESGGWDAQTGWVMVDFMVQFQ